MFPSSNRSARAEIHLNRLKENIEELKQFIQPQTKYMSVIKADAYGHGAPRVAQYIEKNHLADYLAVALIGEALELRHHGISLPILMLTPIDINEEAIKNAIVHDITLTVFTKKQAQAIIYYAKLLNKEAKVHLKVDSGMGRVGIQSVDQALEVLEVFKGSLVTVEGIFTHFSDADNMSDPSYTHLQFKRFKETYQALEKLDFSFDIKHCANTATTINFPDYQLDMVRVGIGTYGYYPDLSMKDTCHLRPVMALKTPIHHVKTVAPGQSIGYGRAYQTSSHEKIATLAVGYADGIPRNLSNQGFFKIGDKKAPITGRVCMDQIMINVNSFSDDELENDAILFGDYTENQPSLYDIADITNGFHYELLCNIHKRIPRVYIKTN